MWNNLNIFRYCYINYFAKWCFLGTITRAKYFYQYLVADWCINLDQMRKGGKQITQISDTEIVCQKKESKVCNMIKRVKPKNCKIFHTMFFNIRKQSLFTSVVFWTSSNVMFFIDKANNVIEQIFKKRDEIWRKTFIFPFLGGGV